MLLNQAAAMVDGVYQDIVEALKPGMRENEIVGAGQQEALRPGLGRRRGDQRRLGRALQPAPAQLLRPDHPARRPGLLRHHPVVQRLPDLLLPDVLRRQATDAQRDAYKQAREWMDAAIDLMQARRDDRRDRGGLAQGRGVRLRERDGGLRPAVRPRPGHGPARAAGHQPPELPGAPDRDQEGMFFALETYCPATDGSRPRASRKRSS